MMLTTIILASNNPDKVEEIKSAAGKYLNIIPLKQAGIEIDIPEPYNTLEENASAKSGAIHQLTNENCFSEDTGLETEALNGAPGAQSARYAGEEKNSLANIEKLLQNLYKKENRNARFRTVISLVWNDREYLFEGICEGKISEQQRGSQGFGYDSVFVPAGSDKTFAEMSLQEKNVYSHRRKAIDKLIDFLKQQSADESQD